MSDSELTLTSPLSAAAIHERPLLALTILWHPDLGRVGEQFIGGTGAQTVELSRFLPLFQRPAAEGRGLGHGGISRDPVHIARDGNDGIRVSVPHSRMVVELNGVEIVDSVFVNAAQVEAGAVLGLGRSVLVCIHWMTCLPKDNAVDGLLGVGAAAIRARDLIRQAAASEAPVLLLGETGTGKEVAARAIHGLGRRASAALVSVNMAALNEALAAADLFGAARGAYTGAQVARAGLFAEARDGTLFLDEIGNAPASVQPMLLRVLENGVYRPLGAAQDVRSNARLIAATDQDVYAPSFNQPLLRRLENLVIRLAPLRARREDIGVLIVHLLQGNAVAQQAGVVLPPALVGALANYDWPGNVRQLAHVVGRAVMGLAQGESPSFAALVDAPRLPAPAGAAPVADAPAPSARRPLSAIGEPEVLAAMEACGWTILAASAALGVSRPSMYKLLAAHPQIRRAEQIAPEELRTALAASGGALGACASLLKTPAEALRRRLDALGLIAWPAYGRGGVPPELDELSGSKLKTR
ncbi:MULTISPECIES: sigma-54 dependent transcriptional regulator [unclassified Duganella]|uniref:sigma-54-dependent transcriptional regulator n=1 Tax=unclassified Duganella TaxID=2636909 RepID=UPI000E342EC3|nr:MULTISPECIES: sigma 54-interacting transcriptional regulator [unclassified Duganella]RFP10211.1 sigma-54-dependent Fis family transcriptional regulator [Duganella sp. BJB475]RFP25483.1 sigma-54-dependent Fis family transcriptional regulator [Duganella sp. BJB476]